MALVTVSSVPLFDIFFAVLDPDAAQRGQQGTLGCLYAAGFDPASSDLSNIRETMRRPGLLTKCFDQQPVSYDGLTATLVLLAVAGLVYWWQPKVRDRQRRTVPVEAVDADGSLRAELAALRERTGIRSDLRFCVDPARMTSGASVYGRAGSYSVCLHAGLLARRGTDPEGFRAVVLHELAHVHHRDVDYAYASTALWRVFLLFALLPHFALYGWALILFAAGADSPWWPAAAPSLLGFVMVGLLLAGLVHLGRADLLRRRELHADLQAVAWGAHPANWNRPDPTGTVAPLLYRLTTLLRTHPGWAERRRVLADSGRLHRVSPLEMFLTGASASLLHGSLAVLPLLPRAIDALWPTVALVTLVLCCVLSLTVVRSSRTVDGHAGAGAYVGLWFGIGLLVGEFVASSRYRLDFLLQQPQYLLAFLFIGAVPTVWWSQSLRLVLGLPGRRFRWAAAVICALVTATLLWGGLLWWRLGGERIAMGAGDPGGAFARTWTETIQGDWQDYGLDLSALSSGMSLLTPLHRQSPVSVAALLMWLVPLVLLLLQRAEPHLQVRRTLGAGLAGGLVSWAGLAAALFVFSTPRPASVEERTGAFLIVHVWWMIATVMAACLVTGALVAAFSRRHWLLRALIAAQVVQLLAYGGVFLFYSADGCLGPMNTVLDNCQWHPRNGLNVDLAVIRLTFSNAVLGSACAALVGANAAWAVRRLRGRPRKDVAALPVPTVPARRRTLILKTGTVLAISVPAMLLTGVANTQAASSPFEGQLSKELAKPEKKEVAEPDRKEPERTPSPESSPLRGLRISSWLNKGATSHLWQIQAAVKALNAEIEKTSAQTKSENGKVPVDDKKFHRLCGTLGKKVEKAQDYFPVPDQSLQKRWSAALSRLHGATKDCQDATIPPKGEPRRTEAESGQLFIASLNETVKGMRNLNSTLQDITKAAKSTPK